MLLFDNYKCLERVASPLNYTGGKFRLLPQILPLFPERIRIFGDLFCGGGNVGLNVEAERVLLNDKNPTLIGLLHTFQKMSVSEVMAFIDDTIQKYGLSMSSEYGYEYYHANSADGLADYNRVPYLKLREDFNSLTVKNCEYYLLLYVLILHAFNNQIRFNREGKFNLPVGKRDFNPQMRRKLSDFMERLQEGIYLLENVDFRSMDLSCLTNEDFVYIDPPYLITCATYNEQGGWNETDEQELLFFLDDLHRRNIRFALSNVIRSKGKENRILQTWISNNVGKYIVHPLNFHYANSNYQTKDRTPSSDEVLIVNYK